MQYAGEAAKAIMSGGFEEQNPSRMLLHNDDWQRLKDLYETVLLIRHVFAR
jgi:hypothetical protein